MARKPRTPRIVHVECTLPSGWRWLKNNARGAKQTESGAFAVTDEAEWRTSLAAAGGREVD